MNPQVGQQVRVVECVTPYTGNEGSLGVTTRTFTPLGIYVRLESGIEILASEVAPVWQVGEVIPEPEGVGTVVEAQYPGSSVRWTRVADEGPEDVNRWAATDMPTQSWDQLLRRSVEIRPVAPTPQPQTREVPLSDIRDGDTVSVSFKAHGGDNPPSGNGLWLSEFKGCDTIAVPSMYLIQQGITVTREIKPLPTTPGTVGTATVRRSNGRIRHGVRIALNEDGVWYELLDFEPVKAADIDDFVELLAGEE